MKKLGAILILVFLPFWSYSQLSGGVNDGNQYGFTAVQTKPKKLDKMEGSTFYQEDFTAGVISIEEMKPLKVLLRYDVANEIIQIKTEKNAMEVYKLPLDKNAEYLIGSEKFVLDKLYSEGQQIYGYFVEMFNGKSYRLLKKPNARIIEPDIARTGYGKDKPGRIEIDEEYYLLENGSVQKMTIRHRVIKNTLNSKDAKKYLSDNKIRSEEDLVQFIAYLDRI